MVASLIDTLSPEESVVSPVCPAVLLGSEQRCQLACEVLAGTQSVAQLAREHEVSRKFVYQQTHKASEALDQAFDPTPEEQDLLFTLPVTKSWLKQFVLSLVLIGHCSYRGVLEILEAVFDYRQLCVGSIHNIVRQAVDQARSLNHAQDLSGIRVAALDEIFQAGKPVLVGVDVDSTYCCLLAFASVLDDRFADLATRHERPVFLVQAIAELQAFDPNQPAHWQRRAELYQKLGHRFYPIEVEVKEILADTPRASSLVENLNSRLRNYFFLRRHLGPEYLELLQFFLNHRRYLRSERSERVGKSPTELLTGQSHPHWLELLGFQRFQRN